MESALVVGSVDYLDAARTARIQHFKDVALRGCQKAIAFLLEVVDAARIFLVIGHFCNLQKMVNVWKVRVLQK